jgi:uncharacterized damage-inducible protein DinB
MERTRPIIGSLLYGRHAHVDPRKVLKVVTPSTARKRLREGTHSCWELLYHMKYWQDIVIRAYQGNESVKDANDADSWPRPTQMKTDSEWNSLVTEFERGTEQLSTFAERGDLMQTCKVWPDAPLIHNLVVEIAHNSYHLGQIVNILKNLGVWPPAK